MSAYSYETHLPLNLADARTRTVAALAAQGFGILTEIDVQATFKKKLEVEFRPYIILGACNPGLAHRAISAEASAGLLLPCNVVLQVQGEGTQVAIADPRSMFSVVGRDDMEPLVAEAEQRLKAVLAALQSA